MGSRCCSASLYYHKLLCFLPCLSTSLQVICLPFILFLLQVTAKFHTCHWSNLLSVILRHLPFLSLCLTIQILCFLALLQLLPLFSFCKVLLLLSSFSLSVLSVLLKAALTDPLLSSAWRLISAFPYSTVPMYLLCYNCLAFSMFYQGNLSAPSGSSSQGGLMGWKVCRAVGYRYWSGSVFHWCLSKGLVALIVVTIKDAFYFSGTRFPLHAHGVPLSRVLGRRLPIRINLTACVHSPLP